MAGDMYAEQLQDVLRHSLPRTGPAAIFVESIQVCDFCKSLLCISTIVVYFVTPSPVNIKKLGLMLCTLHFDNNSGPLSLEPKNVRNVDIYSTFKLIFHLTNKNSK